MPKSIIVMPSLQKKLRETGENIHLARLRRRLSATQVAERAGLSRMTLYAIERGDPSVTLGACASVLFVLGFADDLTHIAADDVLGRKLQDANLTVKQRAPRRPTQRMLDPLVSDPLELSPSMAVLELSSIVVGKQTRPEKSTMP